MDDIKFLPLAETTCPLQAGVFGRGTALVFITVDPMAKDLRLIVVPV